MKPERTRVLYLQPAPLFGGAERQAALNASLLPLFGVDVLPVVGPGPAVVDWLRERGVRTIVHSPNFPGGWPEQRGLGRLTIPFRYLLCLVRAYREFDRLARQYEPDVIVASLPFAWITGGLVARRRGIPIVWRAGGEKIDAVQRLCMLLLTTFLVPAALLCNAEAVRRTFAPLVPAPATIIRNGVDAQQFHPGAGDPSRYRPGDATVVVGYAARWTRAKRPHDLVEAAARLRLAHPGVRFLLGGAGTEGPVLERLARERSADNLSIVGFVSDMPSFFAACDVIVLPSGAEGCPNYLLEAMAMGKPIVASNVAPVMELVRPGHDALVFPLGDVDAFTAAIDRLLTSPDLRATLGARARERAPALSAREAARRLAELVETVVAEHEARRSAAGTGHPGPTPSAVPLTSPLATPRTTSSTPLRSTPAPDPRGMG